MCVVALGGDDREIRGYCKPAAFWRWEIGSDLPHTMYYVYAYKPFVYGTIM